LGKGYRIKYLIVENDEKQSGQSVNNIYQKYSPDHQNIIVADSKSHFVNQLKKVNFFIKIYGKGIIFFKFADYYSYARNYFLII
jgi:hypothetical protein